MKEYEIFRDIKIPPHMPSFVRCDGRHFRKTLAEIGVKKPFDENFAKIMVETAKIVWTQGFNPTLILAFSDELNFLFFKLPFNSRIEKINSILPSILSSKFTSELRIKFDVEKVIAFDSRVVLIHSLRKIIDYLDWRQKEAWRNNNNAYAFYTLKEKGYSSKKVIRILSGLNTNKLHELVFQESEGKINLSKTPGWQRKGILIFQKSVQKNGFNPITGEIIKTTRRKINENWDPPLFSTPEGEELVAELVYEIEDFP